MDRLRKREPAEPVLLGYRQAAQHDARLGREHGGEQRGVVREGGTRCSEHPSTHDDQVTALDGVVDHVLRPASGQELWRRQQSVLTTADAIECGVHARPGCREGVTSTLGSTLASRVPLACGQKVAYAATF